MYVSIGIFHTHRYIYIYICGYTRGLWSYRASDSWHQGNCKREICRLFGACSAFVSEHCFFEGPAFGASDRHMCKGQAAIAVGFWGILLQYKYEGALRIHRTKPAVELTLQGLQGPPNDENLDPKSM